MEDTALLLGKIDLLEKYLDQVANDLKEIKNSLPSFDIDKEKIKTLEENIEKIPKLANALNENIKDIEDLQNKLDSFTNSIKEFSQTLENVKINIKKDTLNTINQEILSIVENIKQKEKEELNKLFNELEKITNTNKNNIEKIQNLIKELNLIDRSKIIGFVGGLGFGIVITAFLFLVFKGLK